MTVCKPVQSPLKLHSHEYRIAFQHGVTVAEKKGRLTCHPRVQTWRQAMRNKACAVLSTCFALRKQWDSGRPPRVIVLHEGQD